MKMQKEMLKNSKLPYSGLLIYDSNKCTGCKVCELVCSFFHEKVFSPSLARIHIFNNIFVGNNSAYICKNCASPKCYYACPIDAIFIDNNTGIPIIDEDICDGCRECAKKCPYNNDGYIIKYNLNKNVFIKCDLCGGEPKCVEWCAPKALSYIKKKR